MFDYKRLVDGTILTTSAVSIFTNTPTSVATIKHITICNYGTEDAVVTLYDGVAGDDTVIMNQTGGAVKAGETLFIDISPGYIKEDSEVFQAKCSVATTCNIRIMGSLE